MFDEPPQLEAALWTITKVLDTAGRDDMLQRLSGRERRYEMTDDSLVTHRQDGALLWQINVAPNLTWSRRHYVPTDGRRILNYELLLPDADLNALCLIMAAPRDAAV